MKKFGTSLGLVLAFSVQAFSQNASSALYTTLVQLHSFQGVISPDSNLTCQFQLFDFADGLTISLASEEGQGVSVPVLDAEFERVQAREIIEKGIVVGNAFRFVDKDNRKFAELVVTKHREFIKVELSSSRKPQSWWGTLKDFVGLNSTSVVCYF